MLTDSVLLDLRFVFEILIWEVQAIFPHQKFVSRQNSEIIKI